MQTPLQKHILQRFGSNSVCHDSTHCSVPGPTHKKCPDVLASRKEKRHCQTISQLTQGTQGREKVSRQRVLRLSPS